MKRQSDFLKTVDFPFFVVLMEFRYAFCHKLTIFALNFTLNRLSAAVEAR